MRNSKKLSMACLDIAYALLRRAQALMMIILLMITACMILEMVDAQAAGLIPGGFCGFDELKERNPDVVAWIRMDGTGIDHPVVQGRDNFEYLSRDIDGKYFQGGCIFLDCKNSADLSDRYLIIHGHHMSGGAMFSDVASYTERDFFENNTNGELITPEGVYELSVAAAGIVDAYEGSLYYTGPDAEPPFDYMDECILRRETEFLSSDKLVLLSTCAGDMTNNRAVVFCRARYIGRCYENEKK